MLACPHCGTDNPAGSRFCNHCGQAIDGTARTTKPDDERKVITALFCDLVGSTELADRLDPEDVDRLLRAYHGIARRRIEAYGGSVEKFIGDAVVGVFGVPAAHEDDPERAIRAGLRLIDEVRSSDLGLHVRIGICTGETLVRMDVSPESGEGFATGDTLNIAARLQSAAPIDGIAAADATHRATARTFRWNDLGSLALKGRAEPMQTWQPLEPVARGAGELVAESTPFVGRDLELETLIRLFERSRTSPSLEVVTIVAEPGIGKSRLVRELSRHVESLPDLVWWRSGRCLPYGDGVGFWALAEIVAAHAGILETDDQATLSGKLDAVLVEHAPGLRRWLKDRLGPLVGLEVAATPPLEEETFAAWQRFLEGIARTRPLVLIVEDLHWADPAFVRFLLHVAANAAGLPILLVVTARPEIEERHPSWLARARGSTVLSLKSLPDASVAELVRVSLPDADRRLVAAILDRAAGSPLYAEQFAAMIRERGDAATASVEAAEIPATIQALLAARIDALPPALKPVLLDASVIGRTFWAGAVATLEGRGSDGIEPVLADLSRREFARPSYPTTIDGEAEYAFWHALVRDVAYGALTRTARAEKHRLAAEWITERSGGASGRTAEIVAEHYARALDLATALGATADVVTLRDAYVDALIGAARHAAGSSPAQAAAHARRALEAIGPDDPRQLEIQTILGRALLDAGEYLAARDVLDATRHLLLERGGPSEAASVAVRLAAALAETGDAARAAEVLSEARGALADRPGPALMEVMSDQAMTHVREGDPRRAAGLAHDVVALADRLGIDPPPRALMALGGDANYARAIEIADRAGDLRLGSRCRTNRTVHFRGHADAWLAAMDEAIEFDRAHGIVGLAIRQIRAELTWVYLGRPMDQEAELLELVEVAQGRGDLFTSSLARSSLVSIRAARGEPVGSLEELRSGWEAAGLGPGTEWFRAEAAFVDGDVETTRTMLAAYLDTGLPPDPAWTFVDRCLVVGARDLAERAVAARAADLEDHRPSQPEAIALDAAIEAAIAGRLAEYDGDLGGATDRYERALATFEEYRWDMVAGTVRLWLGRTLVREGERERGVALLDAARAFALTLGLAPWIAEIDALTNVAEAATRAGPASAGPGSTRTERAP